MMSKMHALFSMQLCEYLFQKYNIEIKRKSLIYGSIKPDASTIFAKYPHYIDRSLHMLTARISMLIDATNDIKEIKTRAFAREMGVATHYLADYFCRVHNDINGRKHDEGIQHIIYEQKMVSKIKYNQIKFIEKEIENKIPDNIKYIEKNSLNQFIIKKHKRYMKEVRKMYLYENNKKRYVLDIGYALEMILTACSYIVSSIIVVG